MKHQVVSILTECLEEISQDVTTTGDIPFLFKYIKAEFIIEQLAQKLMDEYNTKLQQAL